MATVFAAAATVGGFIGATFFGKESKTVVALSSPDRGGPARIAECMLRHHLQAPHVTIGIGPGGIAYPSGRAEFRHCDWPPPGISPDGYSEVKVRNFLLARGNAAEYNNVAIFHAPCDRLDVSFVLDHMDARQFISKRLRTGGIYLVGVSERRQLAIRQLDRVPDDVVKFVPLPKPAPPTFVLLYSGHFAPFDARCAVRGASL